MADDDNDGATGEDGDNNSGTTITQVQKTQPILLRKANIKRSYTARNPIRKFLCTEEGCQRSFTVSFNLRRHLKKVHNIDGPQRMPRLKIKCLHPSCTAEFVHVIKMLTHLETDHGVDIQRENLTFKNIDEFRKWKENEQATNFVYFSKYQGAKTIPKDNRHMMLYYKCQRDGSQRQHRRTGYTPKTNKLRGTVKMGITCPARMVVKVSREDGTVTVEYIQSHSHPISAEDSRRQPMPQSLKDDIEAKLASGLSEDQVLTQLTDGAYMPPGKQGRNKTEERRGDRSSINYAIPVENGMYFINRKRVTMMKRRLRLQTTTDGVTVAKKRKTEEDIAVQVATVKGQLKQLSEELDDERVSKSVLPEVQSFVKHLLEKCSAAKSSAYQAPAPLSESALSNNVVTPVTLSTSIHSSLIQSTTNNTVTTSSTFAPTVQLPPKEAAVLQPPPPPTPQIIEPDDPNVVVRKMYFFDGKNIIQVAIKKKVDQQSNKSSQKSSMPSLTTVQSADDVYSSKEGASSSPVTIINNSVAASDQGVGTNAIQAGNDILLVGSTDASPHGPSQTLPESIDETVAMMPSQTNDPVMEQDGEEEGVEGTTITHNLNDQGVVQIIEQQPQIIYHMPAEGAYVTVCGDVEDGGAINMGSTVGEDLAAASQGDQGGATILLNAIIAANLNIET